MAEATIRDHVIRIKRETTNNQNAMEKTISLQLVSLAVFVLTLIGGFVGSNLPLKISVIAKWVIFAESLILVFSIFFGIVHLLLTLKMWTDTAGKAHQAVQTIDSISDESSQIAAGNTFIASMPRGTTMAFFYMQLACIALSAILLLGVITYLLFK